MKTANGLNWVFCYIVSKLEDFQNLRHYAPRSKEEVETLITSAFPAVSSTKHHIELPKTSYLSKHFVAYIEALVGAALIQDDGPEDETGCALHQGFQ